MGYNTTDLDPVTTFERHVFHRDQFAHYLRWTFMLRETQNKEEIICDFGCGKGNLLEVLYRNRHKATKYVGIDIRAQTVKKNTEKFSAVPWAEFIAEDLVLNTGKTEFEAIKADKVCSFEVLEHVGKNNADAFLQNMIKCGNENATFYISTPNYDEKVGAADNHTYDSGNGVEPQEFTHQELTDLFGKYFNIEKKFGTFASIKDYKDLMTEGQKEVFNQLKEYYDTNLISVIMAPMFPEQARNTIWILTNKK